MAATDVEMLVAALDVDIRKLGKSLENATGKFDKETRKMERRAKQFTDKLNRSVGHFTGFEELKRGLMGLTAVGIAGGLFAIVDKGLKAAAAIKEMSVVTGFSVERLQELRFEGTQTGLTFDKMDQALTFFNKSFGELLNTGKGKLATPFKQFGLDKDINTGKIRNVEQAFDAYIAKVNGVSNASQRANLLADAFGRKMGPQMAEFAAAGAAKLEELRLQAHSLGIVLSEDTVEGAKKAHEKLEALFSVIEVQGAAAVASLAPQIAELTQKIIDGMPSLILWVEKWADWFGLVKMSPTEKLKAEIADLQESITGLEAKKGKQNGLQKWDAFGLFSLSDSDLDTMIEENKRRLQDARSKLPGDIERPIGGKPYHFTTGADLDSDLRRLSTPKLHVPNPNADRDARSAEAEARRADAMAQRVREIIARTGANAATAEAAMAAASDQAAVEMLRGTEGYYDAVKKQIADELAAKLAAFEAERAAQVRHLSTLEMNDRQHMEAWNNIQREYEAKRAGATVEADAKTKEATEEHTHDMQRSVQAADSVRDALEQIGVAGLHGFGSMKQAAASALDQIAQLILRLYVLEPLITSILGDKGTKIDLGGASSGGGSSGGGIGSILSSVWDAIPSFASGTDSAPGGLSQVHKDELINLPKGAQVIPRAPSLAMLRGAGSSTVINVGGSTVLVQGSADQASIRAVNEMLASDRAQRGAEVERHINRIARDRKGPWN